jgi:hypothetical protein
MKSVAYGSGLSLPLFSVSESDPNYWSLRADYEYCCTINGLHQAGIEIQSAESDDYTSLQTSLSDWLTSFDAWLTAMPQDPAEPEEGSRAMPAEPANTNFPALMTQIVTLAISGAAGGIPAIIINVVIQALLSVFEKWLSDQLFPGEADPLSEIAEAIKDLAYKDGVIDFGNFKYYTKSRSIAYNR